MQEIQITDMENIRIGNAQNEEAGTGVTVLLSENGMAAGLDVRAVRAAETDGGCLAMKDLD